MRVEHTLEIDRPIEEVFAYTTNPENNREWNAAVAEFQKLTEGPIGVGTRLRETSRSFGRTMVNELEVITHAPPHRHARRALSGPMPFTVELRFAEAGEATRLTVALDIEPGRFFGIAGPLLKRMIAKQFAGQAAVLKARLEEGQ